MGILSRLFGSPKATTAPVQQLGGRGRKGGSFGVQREFAFVDVETTGLEPAKDRIIEIAIVATDGRGYVLDKWHTLVNPGTGSAGPTKIHGIESEWLAAAPPFSSLLGDIATRLAGRIFVAHNASFDSNFLEAEFKRVGHTMPAGWTTMCTMDIAKSLRLPRRLQDLCSQLGVHYSAHHALDDATACGEAFHRLISKISPRTFTADIVTRAEMMPAGEPSGRTINRQQAAELTTPRSILVDALDRLACSEASMDRDPSVAKTYLAAVGEALADTYVSPEERDRLLEIAAGAGLSAEDLADRRLSKAEKEQIQRAATWLGVDLSEWDAMVKAARKRVRQAQKEFASSLEGKVVAFSGRGVHPNNIREALPSKHSFTFGSRVSKATDLFVVAKEDLENSSVAKARELGIPILVEQAFWVKLGEL